MEGWRHLHSFLSLYLGLYAQKIETNQHAEHPAVAVLMLSDTKRDTMLEITRSVSKTMMIARLPEK